MKKIILISVFFITLFSSIYSFTNISKAETIPFIFTRNFKLGMIGNDVKELQKYLNNNNFPLASNGPGSIGKETTYFGKLTQSALIEFQEKNKSEILDPQELKLGTGILQSFTREFINKSLIKTNVLINIINSTGRISVLPNINGSSSVSLIIASSSHTANIIVTITAPSIGVIYDTTRRHGSGSHNTIITTPAITGVTVPVTGGTPTATIADTIEYTATISWSTNPVTFTGGTIYTATITIIPKTGYILIGVPTNFFTVTGATSTNSINIGIVSAVFPATNKTNVSAPAAPTEVSKTAHTIILNANALNQFSKDGSTWQDSNVFSGLNASTQYTFLSRVKETSTTNASIASTGIDITTNDALIASFTANPNSDPTPLTVNFTNNTSGNATSYLWDFGNGATSSTANPTYVYTNVGIYTVSLTATNSDGSNTITLNYLIHAGTFDDASFSYPSATYCQSGSPQTSTITGLPGGIFTATPAGMSVNPSTGTINLNTSALGIYNLMYETNGTYPNTNSISMTITNVTPSSHFSYSTSTFAQSEVNPLPIFGTGASAGMFTAPAGLVFTNPNTGGINLAASTPNTYIVTNTIPISGSCSEVIATTTVTITL